MLTKAKRLVMKINEILPKTRQKWRLFYAWLKKSEERFAIGVVVGSTLVICFLLLVIPTQLGSHSDEEHGEGHDHEEHSEEVRAEVNEDMLQKSGMLVEEVASAKIAPKVIARGQISENANRSMNVKPRFGGVVKAVYKDFGDKVKKGEAIVVLESASTRSAYTVRSTIDGVIADKAAVVGAYVPENESIFRIVDLTTVWFQSKIPHQDAQLVKQGFQAQVKDRLFSAEGEGSVIYVSPVLDEDTQTSDVNIELTNTDQSWRVGSFAEAKILLEPFDVKVAVRSKAIQELNGQVVVFRRDDQHVIATPVVVGATDGEWTEIKSGLEVGQRYVSGRSFLAKAEILKSTAKHEH